MLLRHCLKPLKNQIKIAKLLNCTKFDWDESENFPKLQDFKSKLRSISFKLIWVIYLLWNLSMAVNGPLHVNYLETLDIIGSITVSAFTIGFLEGCWLNCIGNVTAENILTLMKMMYMYEEKNVKEPQPGSIEHWICKVGKIFVTQLTPACVGESILCTMVYILEPCIPPFLGSIFKTGPSTCEAFFTLENKMATIGFVILQGLLIHWGLILTYLTMEVVYILPLAAMYMYVKEMANGVKNGWPVQKVLTQYGQLKVLEKQLNLSLRHFALPSMFFMFTILAIFFSYAMVTMGKLLVHDVVLLIFPVSFFNATSLYFLIATTSGRINYLSQDVIKNLENIVGRKKHDEMVKSVKALKQLKIRFSDNFVQVATPCVMMDFCVREVACMLLLQN